ncbi:MAG: cobalamin-dependent protein [Desulfovibrionaceae bacterium]|nr:cobalamin-dependent protein [Desulfovibrionaceae bacterium]
MTKIVFVNAYEVPYLGTRCLASFLRKHGFETHNILLSGNNYVPVEYPSAGDTRAYHVYKFGKAHECNDMRTLTDRDFQCLELLIKEQQPDIIGFSARSVNNYLIPYCVPVFKKAAPRAMLVAGGYGPTLEPELYLDGGFDVVVRGDGEEALLQLVQCVETKDFDSITRIHNTFWSKAWGGARNQLCDQKKDLSEYPAPLSGDPFFSYIEKGKLHRNFDPALTFNNSYFTYFGRGCIGSCSYCSGGQWSLLYRQEGKKAYKRRNRNIESVIDELKALPPRITKILFADEYWALSTQKCREFFELYKKHIHLPFWAYLDYEQMVANPDLFELVLDAGLVSTGIGFQTGSGEFALKYYNRKQNYEMLLTYAHMLFKNKISVNPQFIGGNCYETMNDFLQTVNLVRKLPFSIEAPFFCRIQSTKLRAYPQSSLRELAPKVITDPMPIDEWYYRAILLELSRIVSEDKFNEILNIKRYRNKPNELQRLYHILLFNLQYAHFTKLIDEEKTKNWIYYGAGSAYRRNKHFFSALNPKMIMLDQKYAGTEKVIDGIPVTTPEEFFASNKPDTWRFMIFISSEFSEIVAKKLLRTYKVPFEHIHSCTSCFLSPFAADLIDQYHDPTFPQAHA